MPAVETIEQSYQKPKLPQVMSGDTVRVRQSIREGGKQRVQTFSGVVIRTKKLNSLQATVTVRWIASGVGVEKTFLLHSPKIVKVEIIRRSKVRRNFLSYLRERRGKSARLAELGFDRSAVNVKDEQPVIAAADEAVDAEVTELNEEPSAEATGDIEKEVKAETKTAAAEDTSRDVAADADESVAEAEEAEIGLERVEQKNDSAQA
jgi:large subunit ribosomal protein L19